MSAHAPPPPLARRVGALFLTLYCTAVVLLGLPRESGPRFLHTVTIPVRDVLDDHGINPWHFVFAGRRGQEKRRNVAIRFTGTTRDGQRVVLHEAPPGLTAPAVRVFDHLPTTASFKSLTLSRLGRIMLSRSEADWVSARDALQALPTLRRQVLGFCTSATLNGGLDLERVEMDVFGAGIQYETGDQYGRAAHLFEAGCDDRSVRAMTGEAPGRPDWPGVVWLSVP